jgi:hypothetical protein
VSEGLSRVLQAAEGECRVDGMYRPRGWPRRGCNPSKPPVDRTTDPRSPSRPKFFCAHPGQLRSLFVSSPGRHGCLVAPWRQDAARVPAPIMHLPSICPEYGQYLDGTGSWVFPGSYVLSVRLGGECSLSVRGRVYRAGRAVGGHTPAAHILESTEWW